MSKSKFSKNLSKLLGRKSVLAKRARSRRRSLFMESLEQRAMLAVDFAPATNFAVGANPDSVAIEDFNGDGKPDMVTTNYISNSVSVLLGTGSGTLGSPSNFGAGTTPYSMAIADLNGDGQPDLAVANFYSNNVNVLLNTTIPPATAPTVTAPANQSANEGASQSFNLGSFSDANGGPWSVDVDWNDGSTHTIINSVETAGALGAVSHIYGEEGTYHPIVKVTDSTSLFDSKTFTTTVADAALTAGALTTPGGSGTPTVSSFVNDPALLDVGTGLAFDTAGNLYVASAFLNTISKITPSGVISIFVNNTHGLNGPAQLAFDSSGNLNVVNPPFRTGIFKVVPPALTEGQAFSNHTVFHFTDANPFATASDFSALKNEINAKASRAADSPTQTRRWRSV